MKPVTVERKDHESLRYSESGIELKTFYRPEDVKGDYEHKLGDPGVAPYTRGVYRDMYRVKPWTMRQYSGFASADKTNLRFKLLLKEGQTGLSIAFDLPTQLGLDPDDPRAYYEVGRVGVPVPHWREMGRVMNGIDISNVSTSMTINATAMEMLSTYIVVAESRNIDQSDLQGTVQNDILKEFIARNNFIYPPKPSMRYAADIIEYCSEKMPKWNSISISGYHFEEAGATPVQEVAFTIADGIEYVKAMLERNKPVDQFAPRLSFFFSARTSLIEQVAKFRAARRLWAKVMRDRFHAKDPKSLMMRFHVQTAGAQMTASQIKLNIARTAIQALAAVLGGAQSLHVNSYDEALGLPTEEAATLSVRVQQFLLNETDVAKSADPLGGSYMVESLTDELEEKAYELIERVEKMGGMLKAIEANFPQSEIERSSYEYQKRVESGEIEVIGVNRYREEEKVRVLKIDPREREKVISRLNKYRAERDKKDVEHSLSKLGNAAEKDEQNIFPYVLDAIRNGATVGEVSSILREIWGEWNAD
ncbi:MAG: methylmalonyl-CoA mutase family protein [Conexivisphaerales archaeon]